MEETQSEGEEIHLENQRKASDFSENETKSEEEEAQIELEKNKNEEAFMEEEEENPVKSGEEVIIQKTPLENGNENGEEEAEKPQLQNEIKGENRDNPMDMELEEGQISNFNFDCWSDGDDSGSEEEQSAFMKELEDFHKENNFEFKPPKFYGEGLNLLK